MMLRKFIALGALAGLSAAASAGVYTSPGGSIADNAPGSPLVVSFSVTDSGPLASLDVTLTGLTHTWAGDLVATLTAPNGTFANLMSRPGTGTFGDSSDFGGTYRFIDGGADLVAGLAAGDGTFVLPSGDYQATVMLNDAFAGTPLLGTWTLSISDNAPGDLGALGSASLSVTAVPEASTFAMFGLGLLGVAALRRRQSAV
jgi:subtilisin-like proprotein convertase family protein